jgi:hypothetical protein
MNSVHSFKMYASQILGLLLNYDSNFLKVAKLVSEAKVHRRSEVRPTGLWALWGHPGVRGGAPAVRIRVLLYNHLVNCRNISRCSYKHSIKIVKVVAGWYL